METICSSRKYPYPPHGRDWKFRGGGGGRVKGPGISRGGRGVTSIVYIYIFFQTGLNFHAVARKVSLFAFCFSSRECKKIINLANLKHKINIFVLVRLDILSPLASDHFPEWRLVVEAHVVESRRVSRH